MNFFSNEKDSLKAALNYAERGYKVFPGAFNADECGGGKVSTLIKHGYKAASTDPAQIQYWWKTYKKALVCMQTGRESGILALIVKADSTFSSKTPAFSTPFGKIVYIFQYPKNGAQPRSGQIEEGFFIGEGSYIEVPPSSFSCKMSKNEVVSGCWEIIQDGELEEIPAYLLEKMAGRVVEIEATKAQPVAAEVEEIAKEEAGQVEEMEEDQEEEQETGALPALPLECLPEKLAQAIQGVSSVFCVDHWLPFAAALRTAATLVGANIVLEHRQVSPGHLWLCLVGSPSIGKSEITKFFNKPVYLQQKFYSECFKTALEEFEDMEERYKQEKSAALKAGTDCALKKPVFPNETMFYVDDITPEKLATVLCDNPGGCIWDCDEIRGLLASFGRYGGKGSGENAKSRLLSMYSGSPLKIDRAGKKGSVLIPKAWLSVFGTVQPSILPQIFEKDDRSSGFLQRFMFIHAKQTAPTLTATRPNLQDFSHFVEDIFSNMAMQVKRIEPNNPESKPFAVKIEGPGQKILDAFTDEISQTAFYLAGDGEEGEEEQSRAGRWKDQLPRLLLLMHCIEKCSEDVQISGIISKKTVENTVKIFRVLQEHSRQAWRMIKGEKTGTKNFNLIEIIDKYLDKTDAVYELRYPEYTGGKKISEAILEELGTTDTVSTPQALTKALQKLGFEKKKYNKGVKMVISKDIYKKMEARKTKKILVEEKKNVEIPIELEEIFNGMQIV